MKRIITYVTMLVIAAMLTVGGSAAGQDFAASGGNWGLTGNSGTDPNVHALGTLDNQPLVIKTNAAEAMRVAPNGNIGVGVANPQGKVHTSGGDIGFYSQQANVFGLVVDSAGSDGVRINSAAYNGVVVASAGQHALDIAATQDGVHVETAGQDGIYVDQAGTFGVRVNNAAQDGLHIESAGQDGIHIASAGRYAGYFNGTVATKDLQINGGSDLAESFKLAEGDDVQPGMVVAIDPAQPGQLRLATTAYDRTVAGVISGANGIKSGLVMEQEGTIADGAQPVALTGRVYVWADAAYGAIQPGDLLTTSATPGYAMKVSDHSRAQGAILGKAMSGLAEGQDYVLVLISLQ